MPRIVRGDDNGIDVLPVENFLILGVDIGSLEGAADALGVRQLDFTTHPRATLAVKIATGAHFHVVLGSLVDDSLEVVDADAESHADDGNADAVVRTDDTTGRWRGALAVNGGLDDAGGGHCRGGGGGCLDEGPAGFATGLGCTGFVVHR
jgi:hypothetical protein